MSACCNCEKIIKNGDSINIDYLHNCPNCNSYYWVNHNKLFYLLSEYCNKCKFIIINYCYICNKYINQNDFHNSICNNCIYSRINKNYISKIKITNLKFDEF
jgi:hypothetical protein